MFWQNQTVEDNLIKENEMAYMFPERKAILAAELKKVMPKDWKYSLSVRHHSGIVCTIQSAPVDLVAENGGRDDVNVYWYKEHIKGESLEVIEKIVAALNVGNHDNSDPMTDYFDVGWYVYLQFGKWDKPFVCSNEKEVVIA
jgi:hypothetical protein